MRTHTQESSCWQQCSWWQRHEPKHLQREGPPCRRLKMIAYRELVVRGCLWLIESLAMMSILTFHRSAVTRLLLRLYMPTVNTDFPGSLVISSVFDVRRSYDCQDFNRPCFEWGKIFICRDGIGQRAFSHSTDTLSWLRCAGSSPTLQTHRSLRSAVFFTVNIFQSH